MAINTSQGAGTVITEYDQWRQSTSSTVSGGDILSSNWERQDNQGTYIGTGMSTNNGVWTFPRTGIYHIHTQCAGYVNANIAYASMVLDRSTNGGSSWNNVLGTWQGTNSVSNSHFMQSGFVVLDVTNVSDVKIRLRMDLPQSVTIFGGSSYNATAITFIRVGDT
mgnify:CR=1 FL=1